MTPRFSALRRALFALTLPLFAAAIMEIAGPALCRLALVKAGETEHGEHGEKTKGGIG